MKTIGSKLENEPIVRLPSLVPRGCKKTCPIRRSDSLGLPRRWLTRILATVGLFFLTGLAWGDSITMNVTCPFGVTATENGTSYSFTCTITNTTPSTAIPSTLYLQFLQNTYSGEPIAGFSIEESINRIDDTDAPQSPFSVVTSGTLIGGSTIYVLSSGASVSETFNFGTNGPDTDNNYQTWLVNPYFQVSTSTSKLNTNPVVLINPTSYGSTHGYPPPGQTSNFGTILTIADVPEDGTIVYLLLGGAACCLGVTLLSFKKQIQGTRIP